MFSIVPLVNVILSSFKQPGSNFTFALLPIQLNAGVRLLSDVLGALIISSDTALDFHDEISSVLPISTYWLKY